MVEKKTTNWLWDDERKAFYRLWPDGNKEWKPELITTGKPEPKKAAEKKELCPLARPSKLGKWPECRPDCKAWTGDHCGLHEGFQGKGAWCPYLNRACLQDACGWMQGSVCMMLRRGMK